MSVLRILCAGGVLCFAAAATVSAQRRGNGFNPYLGNPDEFYQPPDFHGNPPYDGRFTFARVKYRGYRNWAPQGPGWSHDYPTGEVNLMRILRDVTSVRPFVDEGPIVGSAIVALDDPLLFKYPVAYMSEPGGWAPNDKEIESFRRYFQKGGFMIFDDFRERGWGNAWTNLRTQVGRAFPSARWIQLTGKEPIFDSFFKIDLKTAITWPSTSAYGQDPPTYYAVYEDNDPKKRLIMMANVDNDVSESWEWSGTGFLPVTQSNEAFKLGVNYIIYALTH
jgi:hypothetical protein